jgi:hypothetical protein
LTLLLGIARIEPLREGLVMRSGQSVTVETFDHKLIRCKLIDVRGQTALVCSEKEWVQAKREKREPDCIGWPMANVREVRSD